MGEEGNLELVVVNRAVSQLTELGRLFARILCNLDCCNETRPADCLLAGFACLSRSSNWSFPRLQRPWQNLPLSRRRIGRRVLKTWMDDLGAEQARVIACSRIDVLKFDRQP